MMFSSFNLIIVPIAAGLICHKILYGRAAWLQRETKYSAIGRPFYRRYITGNFNSLSKLYCGNQAWTYSGVCVICRGFLHQGHRKKIRRSEDWMDKILPSLSMVAILLFVTIVVALNRDKLLEVACSWSPHPPYTTSLALSWAIGEVGPLGYPGKTAAHYLSK